MQSEKLEAIKVESLKRKHYDQKYKEAWERDPRFRGGWLEKSNKGSDYYYCNVCNHDGRCGITEIKRHSESRAHKRNADPLYTNPTKKEPKFNQKSMLEDLLAEEMLATSESDNEEEFKDIDVPKIEVPKKISPKAPIKRKPEIQPMSRVAYKIRPSLSNRDEYDIYGENVAVKLRKLKNEGLNIQVQRDIDNLLYDAMMLRGSYAAYGHEAEYIQPSDITTQTVIETENGTVVYKFDKL